MTWFLPWAAAGALLGALLQGGGSGWAVLALALGSALALVGLRVGSRPRRWLGPAALLAALLGTHGAPRAQPLPTGRVEVEGTVMEAAPDGAVLAVVEARGADGEPLALDRLRAPLGQLEAGDRVRLRATLRPSLRFRNQSPQPAWPASSGAVVARDAVVLEVDSGARTPRAALARVRALVRARLHATLSPDAAALVQALVLGDASAVDPEDAEATRRAGLSHVIAVSGMHVTLVVGAIVAMLIALGRRWTWLSSRLDVRRLAWLLGALLAPLYAELAGGSASAWRAAATSVITWSLAALGRRADPLAVTGLVVLGGCIVTPDAVRTPAFVLSVVATAAVLDPTRSSTHAEEPVPREPRFDGTARDPRFELLRAVVRASFRAAVAAAPFTLWCFSTLPPLGVVANIVVVPVVAALLLPVGTVHAVLACVSTELAALTAAPTELLVRSFLELASFFAGLGGPASPDPPDAAELVVLGLASCGLLGAKERWQLALVLAVTALALTAAEAHLRWRESDPRGLRVTFVDVGQGDAALLDMPDGTLWLVDAGGASFGSRIDPGERAIVPLLRARRRRRIDVAVITHPHPDHHGGFAALARRVVIGELWDSGQSRDESPDGPWERAHRGLLVPLRTPETLCGPVRTAGRARVEVLWPCPRFDPGWDANDNSLVLRITYGRRSLLLLGDAEAHTERSLVPQLTHVDVLKVGHHGSRTSSTSELVQATRPWLAVVSAGPSNRFGHPHGEVVERWSSIGTHVARTDEDGSVTVWTDGDALRFETWSGRAEEAPEPLSLLGLR